MLLACFFPLNHNAQCRHGTAFDSTWSKEDQNGLVRKRGESPEHAIVVWLLNNQILVLAPAPQTQAGLGAGAGFPPFRFVW